MSAPSACNAAWIDWESKTTNVLTPHVLLAGLVVQELVPGSRNHTVDFVWCGSVQSAQHLIACAGCHCNAAFHVRYSWS